MPKTSRPPVSSFGLAPAPIQLQEESGQIHVHDSGELIRSTLTEVGAVWDPAGGHWVAAMEAKAALQEAITRVVDHGSLQIWKSNAWIRDSMYEMPLREMRIVAAAISRLRRTSDELLPVEFSVRELAQILQLNADAAYSDIKDLAPGLASQVIHIHDPELGRHDWLSLCDMSYFEGDGRLKISFNPKLAPHLLRLKAKFTVYGLRQILALTSPYQIRLYEWLKSWQYLGAKRELVASLRRVVGADAGSYANFFTFHGRILKPAITAINEHTDLEVTYTTERKNRVANAIFFTIRASSNAPQLALASAEEPEPEYELEPTLFPLDEDGGQVLYDAASTAAQAFVSYWNQKMTQSPFGAHSPTARSEKIAKVMRTDPFFLERWRDLVDVLAESPVWNGNGPSGTGKAFHATPKWFLANLPEVADALAARDKKLAKKAKKKAVSIPLPPEGQRPMDMLSPDEKEAITASFQAVKRQLGQVTHPPK